MKPLAVAVLLFTAVASAILLLARPGAEASPDATVTVNSALDTNARDGQLTLREAILLATAGSPTGTQESAKFLVKKDFIPNSGASVSVSLSCTSGTVSPASASAAEGSPAEFTLTGYEGDPTCTATESPIPTGYDSTGTCGTALISAGECTIVNTAVPPVLLVHGWQLPFSGPGCDGMSGLDGWLEEHLPGAEDRVECFGYNSSGGVIDAASRLKQYIEGPGGILDTWGLGDEGQIHIVAHSMGGLVARYYIEELDGSAHVESLTMLGTPNKGVWLAILGWLLSHDGGLRDLRWGSPVLHRLNDDFPPPELSTRYLVIAGTGDNSPFYWDTWCENDCIVSVNSARGPDLPVSEYEVIHTDLPGWLCGTLPNLLGSESVFQAVLDHLSGAGTMSGSGRAMAQPEGAGTDPDVSPQNGTALDSVDQGETKSHPVWVDASSGQAAFTLFWAGAETAPILQLTLEDPDGTIIDGSTTGVTYAPAQAPGYGGILAEQYLVDAPDSGEWQMRVEGVSIVGGPYNYAVVAYLDSGVSLSAWLDETTYGTGDPVVIAAAPEEDGAAILGAAVSAAITKPNGLTDEVALVDDGTGADPQPGDGEYWGTFTDTSQCGTYEFDFSASGTASEGAFTRQEVLLADAQVDGDAAGDPCYADDDDDGLTDAQEVDDHLTNPLDPDTDGDGFTDGGEVNIYGTDPLDADSHPGPPVGGMAELPGVSGPSARNYIALASLAAAALLALAACAWYARRRRAR